MGNLTILVIFIIGGVCGFFIAKIILKSNYDTKINVLNEQLSNSNLKITELQNLNQTLQKQLDQLQSKLMVESNARASAEERANRIPDLEEEIQGYKQKIDEYHQEIIKLQKRGSELETALQKEQKAMEEKLALLNEAKEKLADAFKALSAEALKSSNEEFLQLARTKLESFQKDAQGELEKRQQAIDELVRPVKETLQRFDNQVQQMEKERISAYEGLKTQVEQLVNTQVLLRNETANLVKALGTPRVRGRWGEIQLRRVVELAGMLGHCDIFEQSNIETDNGRLRPDLIVKLPGGREIVVDAKAPMGAYLDAIACTDEEKRKTLLIQHAQQVRNHIDNLSSKNYWQQFKQTPEFVVLFLPGEIFFSAALEQDPTLIEYGVNEKVIIATPTTLISLLKAVAYGWRQESIADNAKKISELGQELYDRLCTFGEYMKNVGDSLSGAVKHYNQAVSSLESRLFVHARRFIDLEVPHKKNMPELQMIGDEPRLPNIPEFSKTDNNQQSLEK